MPLLMLLLLAEMLVLFYLWNSNILYSTKRSSLIFFCIYSVLCSHRITLHFILSLQIEVILLWVSHFADRIFLNCYFLTSLNVCFTLVVHSGVFLNSILQLLQCRGRTLAVHKIKQALPGSLAEVSAKYIHSLEFCVVESD